MPGHGHGLTDIQKVRLNVADIDPALPILQDNDYLYFLEKNNDNINRASLDAARTILLVLSQRPDEQVDIFSIKGKAAAEQYRLSLQMFLRDPNLNPVLNNCKGWVGGVSKSEMLDNNSNLDNNTVNPIVDFTTKNTGFFTR